MTDYNKISDILNEICSIVKPKRNSNGFMCRCPVCGDSKRNKRMTRLHVDYYSQYNEWIARCYNGGCDISGSTNIISLYAKIKGVSYTQAKKYINTDVFDIGIIKKRLSKKDNTEIIDYDKNIDINLPNECISISDTPSDRFQERYLDKLKSFIKKRKIPDNYQCYVSFDGKYKGRIIIPVIINNKLKYFQGRSIFDNIEPKYLNPDIDKTGIISNSDKFHFDKHIIVTEGIIDSWMVENNQGTSCLGAYFSDDLIKKLLKMTNKGVIICFDNPLLDKAGYDEFIKFSNESIYKNKVRYFLPSNKEVKDLNDVKVKDDSIDIYQYVIDNSYSLYAISSRLKLLYK